MLNEESVIEAARAAGLGSAPVVTLVHTHNHVWRIELDGRAFYLKTFTKDWYRDLTDAGTRACVDHEASAWRILAKHGLATPRIVLEETTCDNPLGRPFILTEALRGRPLTELLDGADRADFARLLRATGEYLAAMHAIAFRFPGYISRSDGPTSPPDPNSWRHPIWAFDAFEQNALKQWETDAAEVPAGMLAMARGFFAQRVSEMKAAFEPPHFTHGDCHAHQFFLDRADGRWVVTGVVDMEVASAGDTGADFSKMFEGLPGKISAATRWWEPLFEGYGREPAFELMKLRLAAAGLGCAGAYRPWPGARARVLDHILSAATWSALFDLRRLRADVE